MTQPVIQVKDLSKCYQIRSTAPKPYHSLREDLVDGFKGLLRGKWGQSQSEDFWALKDVSFDVNQGEVVGIIGRNGAGKSTLLKILSRIVRPTSGEVMIRGRVGSLLEVGTGFHPELTGRENIFMNGAVLGMKRAEIVRKFDEIVAFAEVEKFLDTPVKFYSSGMYVRLAFAVVAHLEPEILIVDEVLAVGDIEFQKKCLDKMEAVSKNEGKTVLLVSHNVASVRSLCQRTIMLHKGNICLFGCTKDVINHYLDNSRNYSSVFIWDESNTPNSSSIQLLKAFILDKAKNLASCLDVSENFYIVLEYKLLKPILGLRFGLLIQNNEGILICGSNNPNIKEETKDIGNHKCCIMFPSYTLNSGRYSVAFGADSLPYFRRILTTEYCLEFAVEDTHGHGYLKEPLPGIIRPKLEWIEA